MDRCHSFDPAVTACFTGHRCIEEPDLPLVRKRVENAIRQAYAGGYRVFLCGGARGFDTVAAQEVIQLRSELPDLRLIIIIPCRNQPERWTAEDRRKYQTVLDQADGRTVLSEYYYTGCMQVRDRYMVDASSLCLCWMTRFEGGTWYTVRHALHSGILLKNLAMPEYENDALRETAWNFTFISPSVQKNAGIVRLYPFLRRIYKRKNILTLCCGKRK